MNDEKSLIPCPYSCKLGAHPVDTKFCPYTGKPLEISSEKETGVPIPTEELQPKAREKGIIKKKPWRYIIPTCIAAILGLVFFYPKTPNQILTPDILNRGIHEEKDQRNNTLKIIQNTETVHSQSFSQLPDNLQQEYLSQLSNSIWSGIQFYKRANILLQGTLQVTLNIDEMGKISIQQFSHIPFKASTANQLARTRVLFQQQLAKMAGQIHLIPIQTKDGLRIRVTDLPWSIPVQEYLKTIRFIALPPQFKTTLEDQLDRLQEFPVENKLQVKGKLEFLLSMDEMGYTTIQKNLDSSTLEVLPLEKKDTVIRSIIVWIERHVFQPVREEDGILLKITDIPITVFPRPLANKEPKDLSPYTSREFLNQMEQLGEIPLNESCTVQGQMWLRLHLNQYGKIIIQNTDTELLQVTPISYTSRIVELVKNKIQSHLIQPIQDENGAFLIISNYLLVLSISAEPGRLKLTPLREL